MATLKERFLLACSLWCDGASPESGYADFWHNWRGVGSGEDEQSGVALIQYARSVGCSADPELAIQLKRILNASPADNLARAAFIFPEADYSVENREQLADLVCGMSHVVAAAVAQRVAPNSEDTIQSLQNAAMLFFRARRLNMEDQAPDLEPRFTGNPNVFDQADAAGKLVTAALRDFENNRDSQSIKLMIRRLLSVLWTDPLEHNSRKTLTYENELKMLLIGSDQRGHVAPLRLELRSEYFHGVYTDPLAFGVTVIDQNMQHSLALAWKCAWQSLKEKEKDAAQAVRLIPTFPVQTPRLGGGSAGALMACGLYATALMQRIDGRRTSTAAIRFNRNGEVQQLLESNNPTHALSPDDIVLWLAAKVMQQIILTR